MEIVNCSVLPENPDTHTAYRLLPNNASDAYYWERVDRNIGWITKEEQEMLRHSVVGIAGCGGMGGLVASILLRAGIGELRLADSEVFDVSNINRQFAAGRHAVDVSKAFATARLLQTITDDTTLVVYPQGINETTVGQFLDGCDLVCDEIEFWAVGARILLHMHTRERGITLLNCDTVGHRTYIFRFTNKSMRVEEPLGFTYEEGKQLQKKIQNKTATAKEIKRVMDAVIRTFIPELPEYCAQEIYKTVDAFKTRLFEEGRASIIATNPPMASGFMANRILLELLKKSRMKRRIVDIPEMPGYLSFDAAMMKVGHVAKRWW